MPLVATVGEGREADPSVPMWMATPESTCSFCGKPPKQTTYQVRGLSATICNECIGLCDEIIAESEIA
ncbi:ATP-dependent Clp protease ATP-binding subunit ClpX [compost metagenome]